MVKVYERINWENEPSLNTPLSEGNLNRMDLALDTIDTRVVSHETTKLDVSVANTMVKNITYNEATGVITVEYLNGTTATLDTKLEKLAVNFRYDPETEKLIITLDDGTTQEVDLSSLITEYDFENTDTVAFTVENGVVKAMIPDGAITGDKLEPNYLANCESAKVTAEAKALAAEGYSLGTQNKQPVGPDSEYYQNNAKYYKEQAKELVGNYIPDPEEKEVGNTLIYDGSGWVAAEIELGTTLIETLATGETEVVFTSDKITEDSTIDFYTSVFGVNPINAEVVNHTIILTFEAQANDVDVKVVIK